MDMYYKYHTSIKIEKLYLFTSCIFIVSRAKKRR